VALKALRNGKITEAITLLQRSPEAIRRVPFDLACRLLMTIAKNPKLGVNAEQLKVFTGKISPLALEAVVTEATTAKDLATCRQLHMLAGLLSIPKTPQTFETLAKAYAVDTNALRVLVEEASTPLARPFAEAVLESCARLEQANLAAEVFEKVSANDASYLRGMVENMTGTTGGSSLENICLEGVERSNCNSDAIYDAKHSKDIPAREVAMRANDIRSCGKNGDLRGAIKVFDRLGSQANNALILNSMLDACVECKDMEKAIEYFK
jgi:hypothetical protein